MAYETIKYEVAEQILTITLNRPDKLNAFNGTMQLAMDIRIASEAARFGFVFSQRGIVPEAASSWFLPRLVGISQALEWCFTGRVFPAQEALAGRLVSKVVPADELLPTARGLAREIAAKTAPVSVALIRP